MGAAAGGWDRAAPGRHAGVCAGAKEGTETGGNGWQWATVLRCCLMGTAGANCLFGLHSSFEQGCKVMLCVLPCS